MDLYTALVIGHIVGTVLGVGGATFLEVFLSKSIADKVMDDKEKDFMHTIYVFVRVGLAVSIVTGIGFLLIYWQHGQTARLLNPVLWAKLSMIAVIIINAVLLHYHKIGLYWGSALSFVSWWSALVLGTFLTNNVHFGYFTLMGFYLLSIVVGAYLLDFVRKNFFGLKPRIP
ncbi:MAG: hypothetical protein Q7S34_03105 [bacterium]|nr:hypothetical protein [bacterium]